MVHLGTLLLVLSLSPSTYASGHWAMISRYYRQSYGLSNDALETVVRVLALESIPLSAAMFVALRSDLLAEEPPSSERHFTDARQGQA